MTRQSPDVQAATRLAGHAAAVARDPRMPEHVRQAAERLVDSALDEISEHEQESPE